MLASVQEGPRAGVSTSAFQPGAAPLEWPRIPVRSAGLDKWFLTAAERGNPATRLDARHPDGTAWTTGNQVRPLLHGAAYFTELLAAIRADVETVFRERWEDPAPLSRNPLRRWRDRILRPAGPATCPAPLPYPPRCGTDAVQVLRTYPYRRRGYSFAPSGERSIAKAYRKALEQARQLVYLEDQYLWCPRVVGCFAEALAAQPELRLIAVVPQFPITGLNQAWRPTGSAAAPQLLARARSLDLLQRLGGERVAIYSVENHAGTPVYVHAKVCVVDDTWAMVGSGNINLRSWTYDSELSCAVLGQAPDGSCLAQNLRLELAREHLDRAEGGHADLRDPRDAFDAFAASAQRLDDWYAEGQRGARPPGRLRRHRPTPLPASTARWADPLYRILYDPDGRPRPLGPGSYRSLLSAGAGMATRPACQHGCLNGCGQLLGGGLADLGRATSRTAQLI